jgi:prepilin-type N-terminal cleavage/methylation domain-containing protein
MLGKMHRPISNEKAFTLIEVIVCLVLIGIMAAIVGMGFMRIAEGYIFAKKNAEMVQKAQVAIARIVKELSAAQKALGADSAITAAEADYVTYTRSGSVSNTIRISGGQVSIEGTTPGILINDVVPPSSFVYYDKDGGTPDTLPLIRQIKITLTVSGANSTTQEFINNVFLQEF